MKSKTHSTLSYLLFFLYFTSFVVKQSLKKREMITTHILLSLTVLSLAEAAYFHNLTIAGVDDEVWIVGPPSLADYLEVQYAGILFQGNILVLVAKLSMRERKECRLI